MKGEGLLKGEEGTEREVKKGKRKAACRRSWIATERIKPSWVFVSTRDKTQGLESEMRNKEGESRGGVVQTTNNGVARARYRL